MHIYPATATPHKTGGLKRFPVLHPSNELLSHARKSVFKTIREDKTIKNGRQRARKLGAEKMDALTKAMCVPIRDVVKGYKTVFKVRAVKECCYSVSHFECPFVI
jgi:hypothetical protein